MYKLPIRYVLFLVAAFLLIAVGVYAKNLCPLHTYATCYDTGEVSDTGSGAHKWACSCGDDVWVKK